MKIKHVSAIRILFDAFLSAPLADRPAIYESLAVLVTDTRLTFNTASNKMYMLEKSGIFIETCKSIAGLDEHNIDEASSIEYAKGNLLVMTVSVQWLPSK